MTSSIKKIFEAEEKKKEGSVQKEETEAIKGQASGEFPSIQIGNVYSELEDIKNILKDCAYLIKTKDIIESIDTIIKDKQQNYTIQRGRSPDFDLDREVSKMFEGEDLENAKLKYFLELKDLPITKQIKELIKNSLSTKDRIIEYLLNTDNDILEIKEDGIFIKDKKAEDLNFDELKNIVFDYIDKTNNIPVKGKFYQYLLKYQKELDAVKEYEEILQKVHSITEAVKTFINDENVKNNYRSTEFFEKASEYYKEYEEGQEEINKKTSEFISKINNKKSEINKNLKKLDKSIDALFANFNEDCLHNFIQTTWEPLTSAEINGLKGGKFNTSQEKAVEKIQKLNTLNNSYKTALQDLKSEIKDKKWIELAKIKENTGSLIDPAIYSPSRETGGLFARISTIFGTLTGLDVCDKIEVTANDHEAGYKERFAEAVRLIKDGSDFILIDKEGKQNNIKTLENLKKYLSDNFNRIKEIDKKGENITDDESKQKQLYLAVALVLKAAIRRSFISSKIGSNLETSCENLINNIDKITLETGGLAYIRTKGDLYKWDWEDETLDFKGLLREWNDFGHIERNIGTEAKGLGQELYCIPYNYNYKQEANKNKQLKIGQSETGVNLRKFRVSNIMEGLKEGKIPTAFDVIDKDILNQGKDLIDPKKKNESPKNYSLLGVLDKLIKEEPNKNTKKEMYNFLNEFKDRVSSYEVNYSVIDMYLTTLKKCIEISSLKDKYKDTVQKIENLFNNLEKQKVIYDYEPMYSEDINDIIGDFGIRTKEIKFDVEQTPLIEYSEPILKKVSSEIYYIDMVLGNIKQIKEKNKGNKELVNNMDELTKYLEKEKINLNNMFDEIQKELTEEVFSIIFEDKPDEIKENIRKEIEKKTLEIDTKIEEINSKIFTTLDENGNKQNSEYKKQLDLINKKRLEDQKRREESKELELDH